MTPRSERTKDELQPDHRNGFIFRAEQDEKESVNHVLYKIAESVAVVYTILRVGLQPVSSERLGLAKVSKDERSL